MQAVAGNQNWQTRVQGVWPEYQVIQNWQVASGSFFTVQENTSARSVALIGKTVQTNLFGSDTDPVGQTIRVRNVPVTIIGVLASKGSAGFQDQDDVILLPFETAQIRLFGTNALDSIAIQATQADRMDSLTQEITNVLRTRHRLTDTRADDFSIRSSNEILETAQGITQTLTLLLSGVAAVSLLVGGHRDHEHHARVSHRAHA